MTHHTPELARAKVMARFIGLFIPLGLSVALAIVFLIWAPRLPDPMATHWGASGEADGFAGPALSLISFPLVCLLVTSLYFVTVVQVRLARKRPGGELWGWGNRAVPAIVLGAATNVFVLAIATTWVQLDLADGRDLAPIPWIGWAPLVAGAVVGVAAFFVQPRLSITADPEAREGEPLELGESERAVWIAELRPTAPFFWTVAIALLVTFGMLVFVISVRPIAVLPIVITGVASLAVAVLTIPSLRQFVRIDDRGLEVRGFPGWPVFRVPASEVTAVEVAQISPFAEFGGWGWRWSPGGRFGIVMREGEGIRITRSNGREFVVTLDDAENAAARLAAAAQLGRPGGAVRAVKDADQPRGGRNGDRS